MQNVPLANRKHIVIFGDTNAGKSALFNAIIGQDTAIVSSEKGTTTDPIIKAMELIPFGPVALVDTAGLGDLTVLGQARMQKTQRMLERADFAIYAADINSFSADALREFQRRAESLRLPFLLVFTKCEPQNAQILKSLLADYPDAESVSVYDGESISRLKQRLCKELEKLQDDESSMIADIVPSNSSVILVCPIDSAAPKGRLILPQVQLLRDCLDNSVKAYVVRETELEAALHDLKKVDLVVTDSQAFAFVSRIVPDDIPLTSFSLLLARQKGKLEEYLQGADAIAALPDNARILVAEGCTHNKTHEDIGHVKIPAALQKKCGKTFTFDFVSGYDFPEDLSAYNLIIHCGGCMLTRKAVLNRIEKAKQTDVPITNYGVVLAFVTGILERCRTVFEKGRNAID